MAKARLMDRPEDYEKLGVNPDEVEVWEDRRRNLDTGINNWEWWYFDSILDDGSNVVVQFFTKSGRNLGAEGDHPEVTVKITAPDGTAYQKSFSYKPEETSYGDAQCDVKFGPHRFCGDLKNYTIYVEETEGVGMDLKLESHSEPYRPGTAYFTFDKEDEFYTWFCVVPKGSVTGTLTYGGKTIQVSGSGYHDHQWGNVNFHREWNNWVWARQTFEDCSITLFDYVSAEKTEYTRIPIVFVQDQDGKIIFESTHGVECRIDGEYRDEEFSGKVYPRGLNYTFENGGKKLEYSLNDKKIIEARGIRKLPAKLKMIMEKAGMDPSYTRYLADGRMKLTAGAGTMERSGELIYEFMFPGKTWKGYM